MNNFATVLTRTALPGKGLWNRFFQKMNDHQHKANSYIYASYKISSTLKVFSIYIFILGFFKFFKFKVFTRKGAEL